MTESLPILFRFDNLKMVCW